MKSKITALMLVILMLFAQVPFTVFAAESDITTDTRAELLTPNTLKNGRVEVSYFEQLTYDYSKYNDGFNQYSWRVIDGALPEGLELLPDTGPTWEPWITGTPKQAGTYTFTIRGAVTQRKDGEDVFVIAAIKTYTLEILPAYPLKISNSALYNGCENQSYSVTLDEDRNRTVTWSMKLADGGELPEGLSIGEESGKLTWENPKAGKYNLRITITRNDESASKDLKLIIEPGSGCTHTNTIKTERKHATCKENGMADYWYCDTCEGYFLNEEYTRRASEDMLDELYTVSFHSDKIGEDGICDTCGKKMPIFKKVTNEDEITSCGMYLVVSKIGDKYYTLKPPKENDAESIEAVEITKNADGTFSYPKSDTDVMVLKTELTAMCNELDAGLPRYSLGTTISGIPYTLSSDDYSGSVYMSSYGRTKYGYRVALPEGETPAIASVYSEYWGSDETGKGGDCGILTAFEGTKGDETKRFFSFRTKTSYEDSGIYLGVGEYYFYDTLSSSSIELYKLTYAGAASGQNYTLSDAKSMVTISNEFTVLGDDGREKLSTASGISEAVATNYVERVVSEEKENITGEASVTTYANISLTEEDSSVNEYGYASISSLVYEITPKIAIKGNNSEEAKVQDIENKNFVGKVTLTLCVGNMSPAQIIHYKKDNTKEYFYNEYYKGLQSGQKTFSLDEWGTGNFVTLTVDSFSKFEILASAKEEPITVGNATVPVPIAGETPTFTAVSDDPSRYKVELLKWIDIENKMDITKTDLTYINSPYYNYKFEAGKKYEVVVRFTAADGYELSYNNNFTINGEKTWWRGDGLIRTYTFVPNTDTVADKNENKFTVTGYNIDGCTVILALYKNNGQLAECKTAVYDDKPIQFTITATDYSSAKVMVCKNLANIKPVTEFEIVNLGQ